MDSCSWLDGGAATTLLTCKVVCTGALIAGFKGLLGLCEGGEVDEEEAKEGDILLAASSTWGDFFQCDTVICLVPCSSRKQCVVEADSLRGLLEEEALLA